MLVALYLRGSPLPCALPRRRWPQVERALRRSDAALENVPDALYAAGLWQEGAVCAIPNVREWALRHASSALTAVSPGYPARWLEQLGSGAPPALWARASADHGPLRPLIGVVGSRRIFPEVGDFAEEVGSLAVCLGYDLISGGAEGCDRRAWLGAVREGRGGVCLWPAGLRLCPPLATIDLSLSAPDNPFTVGTAMERNPLIFAAAEATVVVHARLRAGGGWQGATEALRRRLGPVLVREDPDSPAHRALIALGARPLRVAGDLAGAFRDWDGAGVQAGLFPAR